MTRHARSSDVDPASSGAVEAVRALARLARDMERTSPELSLAHYRVLAAIGSGTERASRVAANLSLGKPAVSASVESLSRRGLVVRSSASDNQRATVLELTVEGRRVLARTENALAARLGELCALAEDGDAVVEALASLGTALDADRERRHRQRHGSTPATPK